MAYLIHSSILLAAFVGFYWLLLRKETFYKLNRWIFLIGILLSLSLPLVTVPAYMSFRAPETSEESVIEAIEIPPIPFQDESYSDQEVVPRSKVEKETKSKEPNGALSKLSIGEILEYIYLFGAGIFSIVFLLQLVVLLARRYTLNSVKAGKYQIVELVKEQEPYSFLNSIFINPNSYDPETYEHIFEHEKVHVDQVHFFDKLLAEILVIVFWFNPFVWILRNVLSENLEFLTDQSLLKKGMPKQNYQMSLLKVSTSKKPFNLTNSYNNSFLKNRILMMNAKESTITSFWKYLFILPLFLLSLMSLNAVQNNKAKIAEIEVAQEVVQEVEQAAAEGTEQGVPQGKNQEVEKEVEKEELVAAPSQPVALVEPVELIPNVGDYPVNGDGASIASNSEEKNSPKNDITSATLVDGELLNLPRINSFSASDDIVVNVRQGNRQSIRISGPDELVHHLKKKVKNGYWDISYPKGVNKDNYNQGITVYLTLEELKLVRGNGASRINGEGQFVVQNNFEINGNGASIISINVKAKNTICYVNGAARMNLSGSANHAMTYVNGSGSLRASNFDIQKSEIFVNGAGSARISAQKELEATITGSGSIRYKGNPRVHKKISGQGSFGKM